MDQTTQSWWFIFYKDQLLLEKKGDGKYAVPCGESSPIVIKVKTTVHNITTLEGRNCNAFSLSSPIEESEQWATFHDRLFLFHRRATGGTETTVSIPMQ